MKIVEQWTLLARRLKLEVYTLYFACRDPRTPWFAKWMAMTIVAYAFSPIDLIPDFIPIVGHLDDMLLIPIGVLLVRAMIPPSVLINSRCKADVMAERPRNVFAAGVIIAIWVVAAITGVLWAVKLIGS